MRAWWKRDDRQPGNDAVDQWAREGLQVAVPDGSFERVWHGFTAVRGRRNAPAPWDLEQAVWRLRLWTRALAGGLIAVTAILVLVLLRQEGATPERARDDGLQALAAAGPSRSSFLATDGAADNRRQDLLGDPRIVLSRVSP